MFMFEKAGSEGPGGFHIKMSRGWTVMFPEFRRKIDWDVLSILETVSGRWQRKPWE